MLQYLNMILIYEFSCDMSGYYYFIMKLVEGMMLCEFLDVCVVEEEDFCLVCWIEVLFQVGYVFDYVYQYGVVYWDVKFENVFVGFFGEVFFLDWGFVKVWSMMEEQVFLMFFEEVEDFLLMVQGKLQGMIFYMLFEQVVELSDIDYCMDVYSFGVVFYEVLIFELMV